jgi:hypothetical protein
MEGQAVGDEWTDEKTRLLTNLLLTNLKAPHKSASEICCYVLLFSSTTLVYSKYIPKIITSYNKAISPSKVNSPDNTIECFLV